MMTFEQRMAELGVDLSDMPDEYSMTQCASACIVAGKWAKYTDHTVPYHYILHLVDVIDRMETRLVNVTGERDWALKQAYLDCPTCANANPENPNKCSVYDIDIGCPDDCYEFGGVPEDWRPDDDV